MVITRLPFLAPCVVSLCAVLVAGGVEAVSSGAAVLTVRSPFTVAADTTLRLLPGVTADRPADRPAQDWTGGAGMQAQRAGLVSNTQARLDSTTIADSLVLHTVAGCLSVVCEGF